MNRKDFLKGASALILGAAIGLPIISAIAIEPVSRVGGASIKISCNAYSFGKLLNDYLPIETLSPRGREYDPYKVVPDFLNMLREAISATA